jgi:hypothetical protein
MSDLRTEIVSKVLKSWDTPVANKVSLSQKVFDYIQANPSSTSVQVTAGTGIDIGRASALMLALYSQGKLDRKAYPNPNPDGKHANVYAYWTQVNNFTDKGISRKPKKEKKLKKVVIKQVDLLKMPRMKQVTDDYEARKEFDPEQFVHGLSLTEVKKLHKFLEEYFG